MFFRQKMTIFLKTLDMLVWSPFLLHSPKNLKTDQIQEWKLTVLNNRWAILKKWKWTVKIDWLWTSWTTKHRRSKSSLHYLLSVFELSAWIQRTANFHAKDNHLWTWLGSSIFTFRDHPIWIDAMHSRMDRLLSNWSLAFQSTLPQESWLRTVHFNLLIARKSK